MPLSRSNTRSKSRSPIPPPASISPRPFLPPSHYAAAGGLAYPGNNTLKPAPKDCDVQGPSQFPQYAPESQSLYQPSFMPISYPSQSSNSDSSFEFRPALGRRSSINPSSSSREKRQSRMSNLPLLEAHLLPSLRDTIDRMTRPPSRISTPSSPSVSSHLSPSTRQKHPQTPSFSSTSSAASSNSSPGKNFPPNPPSTPQVPSTPKPLSNSRSGAATPIEVSTPKPKPRSALKSALRAPTPRLFSGKSGGVDSPLPSPVVTSRSVKSILGKKTQTLAPLSASDVTGNNSINLSDASMLKLSKPIDNAPSTRTGRARSRTDPGAPSKLFTPTPYSAATPQPSSSSDSSTNSFTSFLPRPHLRGKPESENKPALDHPIKFRPHASADDSDLDYPYEMDGRERRRLIVTNADSTVISSSSESEGEQGRRSGTPVLDEKVERKGQARATIHDGSGRRGIGLGLGLEGGSGVNTRGKVIPPDLQGQYTRHEGDNLSMYEGAQGHGSGGYSLLSSHPSDATSEFSATHSYRGINELDEAHRRRTAALMGIVNGLDLGLGSGQSTEKNEESGNESEYYGEEGVAVSGSGDVAGEVGRVLELQEEEEEKSEYGSEDDGGVNEGRMEDWNTIGKMNAVPTFVVSMEGDRYERARTHSDWQSSARLPHGPLPSSPRADSRNGNKGRKSPSRSPVIRQNEVLAMPAALKRHSVYHVSSSPDLVSRRETQDNYGIGDIYAGQDKTLTQEQDFDVTESLNATQSPYAVIARERRAFGIPPSESEELYNASGRQSNGMLSHADSDLSSVGSGTIWHDDCEELSVGAEALFRKLSGGQAKEMDRRSRQTMEDELYQSELLLDDGQFLPEQESLHGSRLRTPISDSSSASSVYESPLHEKAWQKLDSEDALADRPSEDGTWHSDIPVAVYNALVARHGEVEMQRQEIIWELYKTEETFISRLHTIVRLFILPLRVRNTKTWISGVSSEVARLFDWLEDIVNLHSQMLSALQAARAAQYPVVEQIAESMRAFVPRLEVYQPYLVRLVDVAGAIGQLVADDGSDFGEFVRMQEKSIECDGWNLERFLVEPVNRLAKYPDLFRQLQDLTPKNHPDYLPTFSLLHSTEMIIRVMTEVKMREDEYDLIKDISTRIRGLPPTVQLARRERRLLTRGTLNLNNVIDHSREANYLSREPNNVSYFADHLSVSSSQTGSTDPKRNSRLVDAISEWDTRRGRSGSTASSSTGVSFRSYGTGSSGSSGYPVTPSSAYFSSRCNLVSSSPTPFQWSMPRDYLQKKQPLTATPSAAPNEMPHPTLVHVFVFTDLALLVTPVSKSKNSDDQEWTLLNVVGMARIVGVTEFSDKDSDALPLIILDILPVNANNLDGGIIPDTTPVMTLHLSIPREYPDTMLDKVVPADDETRQMWLSAFHRCFRFTLRSLSLPTHSGGYLVHGPNVDLEFDTQHSVLSILASGLPLPKSPSVQVDEIQRGETSDAKRLEREERGWWSLRFQQVLREIQRQDISFTFDNPNHL